MTAVWIVIGIVVLLVIFSAGRRRRRWRMRGGAVVVNQPQNANTSNSVLNDRYAKGEITKDEYEQKKRDMQA